MSAVPRRGGAALSAGIVVLLAGGCAQETARPAARPALNVYTSFAEPVPGTYALFVDDRALTGRFEFQGGACVAHAYPVDARSAFTTSIYRTLVPLIAEVDLSERAVTSNELDRTGIRGVIFVRAQDVDVDLIAVDKLFDSQLAAEVGLTASVLVDDRSGRALGATVVAEGEAVADAGSDCSGGTVAIERAMGEALEELSRQIGDRIANSSRLRGGASPVEGERPPDPQPQEAPRADPSDPGSIWIDRGRGQREPVL